MELFGPVVNTHLSDLASNELSINFNPVTAQCIMFANFGDQFEQPGGQFSRRHNDERPVPCAQDPDDE